MAKLESTACREEVPIEFRIAAKLVESRIYMEMVDTPLKIGVVFAMWGEHNCLLPWTADNPNGEDSLRVKLEQMAWITRDIPVEWILYAVDDGSTEYS